METMEKFSWMRTDYKVGNGSLIGFVFHAQKTLIDYGDLSEIRKFFVPPTQIESLEAL